MHTCIHCFLHIYMYIHLLALKYKCKYTYKEYVLKKCFGQLPDIPALHRTSQGRCRTSQVSDIPALRRTSQGRFRTSQGRCRTSRPCAGHLKAGAGHLKTGTGHPGQALDFLMNSIKDHNSSPRSKSLTLPVANWPTECLRTKPSTLLGSHSFLLLSKVSFSSS